MTDYITPAMQVPLASYATTKPVRDALLTGLPDGAMRFLFDLDFSWCYPGGNLATRSAQTAPTDGQTIYDIAERADGAVVAGTNRTPAYSGGGVAFDAISYMPSGVEGPSNAWETIHGATGQYFLQCSYWKLPSSGNWKPSNSNLYMFDSAAGLDVGGAYITNADPLCVYQIDSGSGPRLEARRQTAIGASSANGTVMSLTPTSDHFSKMCQVAVWRNADGHGFRIKSSDGEVSTTAAVGLDSAVDFSSCAPSWGYPSSYVQPMNSEDQAATDYSLYRGWLEDLGLSGRDPLTVLNADWTRVQARIAASGGTIFV